MSKSDTAVKCFMDGFNCAQAVLSAYSEEFNMSKEMAYKVAGAFGSGMGQLGETCGAVTGALMVIGLKYGKYQLADTTSKDKTYVCVKQYSDMFKQQYGSIKCQDLINFDLSKADELIKARESGVFRTICHKLIASSVEMVEKVIGVSI